MTRVSAVTIASLICSSGFALGQDSVSRNRDGGNGLPGDAIQHWTGSGQRTNYVVDLAPLTTSWGTTFGIAPVVKSGRVTSTRFTAFNLSSSISPDVLTNVSYPANSYLVWSLPGSGVNTLENNAPTSSLTRSGNGATVLALGSMDFEEVASNSVLTNQIVGAQIAFDPATPSRLYVSRVVAAHNTVSSTVADLSQFGYGAVDASSNLVFRADGFGVLGSSNQLTGDNLFRVRLNNRASVINSIGATGGSDASATDRLLNNDTVTHSTPNLLPASIASRSVLIAPNFRGEMRYESAPSLTSTTTLHRSGAIDHRGGLSVLAKPAFASSVATGACLAKLTSQVSRTDSISVFGFTSAGTVTGNRILTLPPTLNDTCDTYSWPFASGEFRNYDSQVAFRGGSAQVALSVDAAGRVLAAATVYNGTVNDAANPFNAIAVARFNPASPTSPVTWTLAAWVDSNLLDGKVILGDFGQDGAPGTNDVGEGDGLINSLDAPVGRLASLTETMLARSGPSMSAPAMDAAGNIYFISATRTKRFNGTAIVTDTGISLIRAVYNPDTFCYRLELVCKVGDTFLGPNSGRRYRISSLGVADSDSISSASLWAGSVNNFAWNNTQGTANTPVSPVNLGGLVLSARIDYDVNEDGLFQDPTLSGGNTASVDESYNVLLYIGNTTSARCPADWDNSGGVDGDDVIAFFADWDQGNADYNNDGGTDGDDVISFFGNWDQGC